MYILVLLCSIFYSLFQQNPCSSSPCLNNGICQVGYTAKGFRCKCPPPFIGEYCEQGAWRLWFVLLPRTFSPWQVYLGWALITFISLTAVLPHKYFLQWSNVHMMCMKHTTAYISGNHDVISLRTSQKLSEIDVKNSKMHAKTVTALHWHEPKFC